MSEPAIPQPAQGGPHHRPWDFRLRRGRNWFVIGLTYASYYLNRYNVHFAAPYITRMFGFSNTEYGAINSGRDWSYAIGQFVNGLLSDRMGGKMAMAIGGYGTALLNVLFGLGFYFHKLGPATSIIWYFVLIRSFDGYTQAFGAPGMVKMNAAWFARPERGGFAGIFGLMINLGRIGINTLAPILLVGFTIGTYTLPPGHWQLVFFVPAAIVVVITTLMLLLTKPTPEAAGYPGVIAHEAIDGTGDEPLPLRFVLKTILGNRLVWLTAWAYFCTGVVRSGVDSWFPKYFVEARGLKMNAGVFEFVAWMVPIAATLGSIISGYVSDLVFRGRRAPVAAFLYAMETLLILIGAQTGSLWGTAATLVAVAFTCNATHSILGAAAPMDFGGRKMAGFACGVIDSWQYIGAGLAGIGIGRLIDHFGWGAWLYSMASFGAIGFFLMLIMNRWERKLGATLPLPSAFPVVVDDQD